ncbi:MAG: hypothetical protein ACJAS6_001118 [Rickettsiales bacterium]|jgi:hypothetical protein
MWTNFNDSKSQKYFETIPQGSIAKARMIVRQGGYDDKDSGWSGGYVSKDPATGAFYLSCEFLILEGDLKGQKISHRIGLHNPKDQEWENTGRSFIRAILSSSRGFKESDNSKDAQNARKINDFSDLDCIEFIAKIDIIKDYLGCERNAINFAITPDHEDYEKIISEQYSTTRISTKKLGGCHA